MGGRQLNLQATGRVAGVNEEAMEHEHGPEDDEQRRGLGPGPALVPLAGFFYAIMFGAALLWGAIEGRAPVLAPGAREPLWGFDLALGLGTGLILVGLSDLITRLTSWGDRTARILGEMIGPVRTGDALWLAALSGIAEELLFRGAVQPHLGLAGTSLLFGLAHLAPRRDLMPWTLMAIAAGLVLGGLFQWTGNVLAPIAAHFTVNAVNLRLLSRRFSRSEDEPTAEDP